MTHGGLENIAIVSDRWMLIAKLTECQYIMDFLKSSSMPQLLLHVILSQTHRYTP